MRELVLGGEAGDGVDDVLVRGDVRQARRAVLLHPHLVLLRLIRGAQRRLALVRLPLLPDLGVVVHLHQHGVRHRVLRRELPIPTCAHSPVRLERRERAARVSSGCARGCVRARVRARSVARPRSRLWRERRARRGAYDRRRRKQTRSAGHLGPGHTTCDRVTTFFMGDGSKRCVLLRRPPAFALRLYYATLSETPFTARARTAPI